jgi:hypothetical protein
MMKPGSENQHGQQLVGPVDVSELSTAELEQVHTVCNNYRGFCIVRLRFGLPDLVCSLLLGQNGESDPVVRERLYECACRDLRSWVLSFNSADSVKWLKNVGYLANDLKVRGETKLDTGRNLQLGVPDYVPCSVDDADGAVIEARGFGFFVREVRDGI